MAIQYNPGVQPIGGQLLAAGIMQGAASLGDMLKELGAAQEKRAEREKDLKTLGDASRNTLKLIAKGNPEALAGMDLTPEGIANLGSEQAATALHGLIKAQTIGELIQRQKLAQKKFELDQEQMGLQKTESAQREKLRLEAEPQRKAALELTQEQLNAAKRKATDQEAFRTGVNELGKPRFVTPPGFRMSPEALAAASAAHPRRPLDPRALVDLALRTGQMDPAKAAQELEAPFTPGPPTPIPGTDHVLQPLSRGGYTALPVSQPKADKPPTVRSGTVIDQSTGKPMQVLNVTGTPEQIEKYFKDNPARKPGQAEPAGDAGRGSKERPWEPQTTKALAGIKSGEYFVNPADGKLYRKK